MAFPWTRRKRRTFNAQCLLFLILLDLAQGLMDSEQNYVQPKGESELDLKRPRSFTLIPRPPYGPYHFTCRRPPTTNLKDVSRQKVPKVGSKEKSFDLGHQGRVTRDYHVTENSLSEDEAPYIVVARPKHLAAKEKSPQVEDGLISPEEIEEEEKIPIVEEMEMEASLSPEVIGNGTMEKVNKSEPEIPSFREWAQKTLEEEQKKMELEKKKKEEEREKKKLLQQSQQILKKAVNDSASAAQEQPQRDISKSLKKNFASLDCGAKVVSANAESQGAGNIISTSRDEYMLNKCSDKAWFVVELCESIKALKLEIANFELYSSVPNEIRVWMVNNFPAREKDWVLFGQFHAEDDRIVQSFTVGEGVFGKYVRVEILSHHGTEHYCPISLFRMYGISEIELIGADDDDDDDDIEHDQLHFETENNKVEKVGFVSYLIEKVVGVFRAKDQVANLNMNAALNSTSLVGTTFMYNSICPGCDIERYREVFFLLSSNYKDLCRALKISSLRNSLENGKCQSLGFNITVGNNDSSCGASNVQVFYETLFGTSRTIALCNVIAVEMNELTPAHQQPSWNNAKDIATLNTDSVKNSSNIIDNSPQINEQIPNEKVKVPDFDKGENKKEVDSDIVDKDQKESSQVEKTVTPSPTGFTGKSSEEMKKQDDQQPPAAVKDRLAIEDGAIDKDNKVSKEEEVLKEPPRVVHVTPSSASHVSSTASQTGSSAGQTNGGQQQNSGGQKESVWQKLSNKIKALERNVGLSGGYLEELSVTYKKQIEDLQLSAKQSSESLAAATELIKADKLEISQMKKDIQRLTSHVEDMNSKFETFAAWALGFHFAFLIMEVLIGFVFVCACYSRRQQVTGARSADAHAPINNHVTSIPNGRPGGQAPYSLFNGGVANRRLSAGSVLLNLNNGLVKSDSNQNLSKKQRKKIIRRMNKVSSVGRLEDLVYNNKPLFSEVYHTYHSGTEMMMNNNNRDSFSSMSQTQPKARRKMSFPPIKSRHHQRNERSSDSEDTSSNPGDTFFHRNNHHNGNGSSKVMNSRFGVTPIKSEVPTVETGNMFGVLNNSLHDDPTPVKERSLVKIERKQQRNNEFLCIPIVVTESSCDEGGPEMSRKAKKKSGKSSGRMNHRSKSTSPQRIGINAKQKVMFRNFNPDNAEWIKK